MLAKNYFERHVAVNSSYTLAVILNKVLRACTQLCQSVDNYSDAF